MSKKDARVVIAKKKILPNGKVVQGDPLSIQRRKAEYRKPEFALHALPSLLEHNKVSLKEVGLFRGGHPITDEEMLRIPRPAPSGELVPAS